MEFNSNALRAFGTAPRGQFVALTALLYRGSLIRWSHTFGKPTVSVRDDNRSKLRADAEFREDCVDLAANGRHRHVVLLADVTGCLTPHEREENFLLTWAQSFERIKTHSGSAPLDRAIRRSAFWGGFATRSPQPKRPLTGRRSTRPSRGPQRAFLFDSIFWAILATRLQLVNRKICLFTRPTSQPHARRNNELAFGAHQPETDRPSARPCRQEYGAPLDSRACRNSGLHQGAEELEGPELCAKPSATASHANSPVLLPDPKSARLAREKLLPERPILTLPREEELRKKVDPKLFRRADAWRGQGTFLAGTVP